MEKQQGKLNYSLKSYKQSLREQANVNNFTGDNFTKLARCLLLAFLRIAVEVCKLFNLMETFWRKTAESWRECFWFQIVFWVVFSRILLHVKWVASRGKITRNNPQNWAATDSARSLIMYRIKYFKAVHCQIICHRYRKTLQRFTNFRNPLRIFHCQPLVTTPHFNISISLRFFRATQKFRFILRNVALWLRDERTWHYLVEIKFSFRMKLHFPTPKKWRKSEASE